MVGGGRGSGVLKWTIYIGGWRKGEWCIEVEPLYWWVEEGGVLLLKWTIYIGGWRKGECCIEVDHLYLWVEEGGVLY